MKNKRHLADHFEKSRLQGMKDMLTLPKKSNVKTKEEMLWSYLLKRCDTTYEARLMYNAIVRTMKSNRPTEVFK